MFHNPQFFINILGATTSCCAAYGHGSGPVHMDDVRCVGNESSLIDCPHSGCHDCGHNEDAGVQCQTSEQILIFIIIQQL